VVRSTNQPAGASISATSNNHDYEGDLHGSSFALALGEKGSNAMSYAVHFEIRQIYGYNLLDRLLSALRLSASYQAGYLEFALNTQAVEQPKSAYS